MDTEDMKDWSSQSSPAGQGLVLCDNTGRTVAVVYDVHDAPLVAAAPALKRVLEALILDCETGPDWRTIREAQSVLVELRNDIQDLKKKGI